MTTTAEVKLWGKTIGAVSLGDNSQVADFEYDSRFITSGIEVAPLMMPLSNRIYRFPSLAYETFSGLPGLLADSLPDKFGNALINAWLAREGRSADSFNAVERLCYTGKRGMGALEYHPITGPRAQKSSDIEVDKLVALASEILTHRQGMTVSFEDKNKQQSLREILRVGTSAGGARAKAVIAWNPQTNQVRSGQVKAEPGFQYWLLKFDGVKNNLDKEITDPKGYGVIEYAYSQMAKDAGIEMTECRLLEENGRKHFMTKRFDRKADGEKLHVQTLGAMAHLDYNKAGVHSYEEAFLVMRKLMFPASEIEQLFRRMVFNIIARNQDDHVKNISFMMDKAGSWSLSPAYDMTYSYDPQNIWMKYHQMTMNGKQNNFGLDDFEQCAKTTNLRHNQAKQIIQEIDAVISNWRDYADEAKVDPEQRDQIQSVLRVGTIL